MKEMTFLVAVTFLAVGAGTPMCGGGISTQCTPGASASCVGPGACAGYQVCSAGGTFDSCICGDNLDASFDSPDVGPDVVVDVSPPSDAPQDSPNANDASSLDVKSIPGVVLWLEGDLSSTMTISAGHVARWFDQTSHLNDALGSPSDSTQNPAVKSGAISGIQALHFDQGQGSTGNMLTILDNGDGSLEWGTGDFYVVVVADFDNDTSLGQNLGVGTLYSKLSGIAGFFFYANVPNTNTNPQLGLTMGTAYAGVDYMWTGTAYNNGVAHVFAARRRNGGNVDLIVDGASVTSGSNNTQDVSESSLLTHIGAEGSDTTHRLDGDIGEIIAVKGTLAPSDEAAIEGYLRAKWGTP